MPNFCDSKLTITGANRQAVLDKIKGKPYVEDGKGRILRRQQHRTDA
jgi:hypothetical protein